MISIKVKTDNLTRFNAVLKKVELSFASKTMRGAMSEAAEVLKNEVAARVPIKTGRLRASIRASVFNRRKTVVGLVTMGDEVAYYAHMIEGGTRPHIIKPSTTKALVIGGKFYGSVRHPGMRAKHPVMFAAYAAKQGIINTLENGIARRLDKAVKM